MENRSNPILEVQAHLAYNRQTFLLNYGDMVHVFTQINHNFESLRKIVGQGRDKSKRTHISMLPFVGLMQRQAFLAFDSLFTSQSFQAWGQLRPCVEAALIMGKWLDDPTNADVWKNRVSDLKRFKATYEGKALQSSSLSNSDLLQLTLKRINDEYMHTNVRYYGRHLNIQRVDEKNVLVEVECFDSDSDLQIAVYAVSHLLLVIQTSLLETFKSLFNGLESADFGLQEFESVYGQSAKKIADTSAEARNMLSEFGLWRL